VRRAVASGAREGEEDAFARAFSLSLRDRHASLGSARAVTVRAVGSVPARRLSRDRLAALDAGSTLVQASEAS